MGIKWNEVLRFYTLDIADIEWVQVWKNVHNHLLPFEIQSTIWIMLHLNFYCGYKEKLFNYGDGFCKLCGEREEGAHHIITECEVMKACIDDHQTTLLQLHDQIMFKDEMAFGLVGEPIGSTNLKTNLRNFLTFIIRHVVFKNRYIDFGGKERAKLVLKNKIRDKLKKELMNKWIEYKAKNAKEVYRKLFLIENIVGYLDNDSLIINI